MAVRCTFPEAHSRKGIESGLVREAIVLRRKKQNFMRKNPKMLTRLLVRGFIFLAVFPFFLFVEENDKVL